MVDVDKLYKVKAQEKMHEAQEKSKQNNGVHGTWCLWGREVCKAGQCIEECDELTCTN